jgi:hypothetical protein
MMAVEAKVNNAARPRFIGIFIEKVDRIMIERICPAVEDSKNLHSSYNNIHFHPVMSLWWLLFEPASRCRRRYVLLL